MNSKKVLTALFICLLIPLAVGGISGFATATSINDWYLVFNLTNANSRH